jgi:hypothetical protein
VGRSRSAASNLLRLLNLAEPVQQMLMAGDIDMGHARALLPLDKALQITTAHEVIAKKLNVREAEKLVAKVQGVGRQAPLLRVKSEKSRDVQRLEEQLSDLLTAQVEIRMGFARGRRPAVGLPGSADGAGGAGRTVARGGGHGLAPAVGGGRLPFERAGAGPGHGRGGGLVAAAPGCAAAGLSPARLA